ncbi:MAG: Squalene-hopene cyclase C-terminal domain [Thermoplasmata archaeon]|nr:Squalene-hopene cyclase C-terminal domain [Thermoplasmata archaeon]
MRPRPLLVLLLPLLLLLQAPPAAAHGGHAHGDLPTEGLEGAFAWLEMRAGASMAAPVTEAQALAGRVLTHAQAVDLSANGTAALRPLHALALAYGPGNASVQALRDRVLATFDGHQFGDPQLLNDDAWSLKALRAAGVPAADARLQAAADALLRNGTAWSHAVGAAPDVDSTGMVLEGLAAAGRLDAATAAAAGAWVRAAQDPAGGWPMQPGGEANCDSTVWGIRALRATGGGEVPAAAWSFLAGLQGPDGGLSWVEGQPSNAYCTAEAAALWAETGGGPATTEPADAPAPFFVAAALALLAAASTRRRRAHKP